LTSLNFPLAKPYRIGGSAVSGGDHLRADGRFLVSDQGLYRAIWASGLTLCMKTDEEIDAFCQWASSTGFNGFRTFCGTLDWASQTLDIVYRRLPTVLAKAADHGLTVEVTAITGSGEGWDVEGHVDRIAQLCERRPNVVVELANETQHPSQSSDVHDASYLGRLYNRIKNRGFIIALGAYDDDESIVMAGGDYVTCHLDRGRDKWNQVRRVRELENVSAASRKYVLNNEPIGADELMGGPSGNSQRRNDPEFFFCMGVLDRLFEVGGVFHSTAGLNSVPPGEVTQRCAEAFVEGSTIVDTEDRLAFKNAGWGDSPVKGANFGSDTSPGTVVRTYSGITGNTGYLVLVGVTGDPRVEFQLGWRIDSQLADVNGCQVFKLTK
jgi:hypothetical protein